ncbi:MAG: M48 family metallopeptidase [Gammaproteobacteria bacterium]|nr:M48 family metallopeptidase [Gammaproteobacteria bacterium]NVK88377.1 M48 family metallopeptidase [Gammaproteobacteria bacterium]
MYRTVIMFIVSCCLLACVVSPTGRKQVLFYSDDDMSQMGSAAYDQIKQQQEQVQDSRTLAYVTCVTKRLTPHLPREFQSIQWEVNVFKDESANAFALPGGKIGVNSGMLALADNPDMLAAVIGHEIGHVWAQHGNARMSKNALMQVGLAAAAIAAGEQTPETEMALAALGLAGQGVVLAYSRKHETEADELGLQLMAKGGFDPQQAIELWRKMAAKGGSQMPEFLSTHPKESTRIKDLQGELPRILPFYQAAIAKGKPTPCRR